MKHYLMVDLGTGNSRVALVDSDGGILGLRTYTNVYHRDSAYEDGQYFLPEDWAALLLRDVRYVIEAHFDVTDKAAPGDNPGKFQDIVKRRIQRGQFYHQPCFGCREFPAQFRWCEEPPPCPEELKGPRDLGWMLYDMDYTNPEDIRPLFFRASLEDGVLRVPGRNSREVRG